MLQKQIENLEAEIEALKKEAMTEFPESVNESVAE